MCGLFLSLFCGQIRDVFLIAVDNGFVEQVAEQVVARKLEVNLVSLGEVVVVVGDIAAQGRLKSQQQAQQGGFSASRHARNAHVFTSLDVE